MASCATPMMTAAQGAILKFMQDFILVLPFHFLSYLDFFRFLRLHLLALPFMNILSCFWLSKIRNWLKVSFSWYMTISVNNISKRQMTRLYKKILKLNASIRQATSTWLVSGSLKLKCRFQAHWYFNLQYVTKSVTNIAMNLIQVVLSNGTFESKSSNNKLFSFFVG